MGERKVLNKYYPPDFDPSKIPRRWQRKNHQMKVRTMLPMSIRCNTCGNYIGKGTKFNSPKEDVVGETYLGISIFRFYFNCTNKYCSAEITYKTDPQNSDYRVEAGATRNFEPWRSADEAVDEARKKRDAEEMGDAMRALENRTMVSKQEMDRNSTLDELIAMKARRRALGTELVLEALRGDADMKEKELAEEDEAILQTVVFHNSVKFVRRLEDDTFDNDAGGVPTSKKARPSFLDNTGGSKVSTIASLIVSSSQASTPAALNKASTFTAKPKFVAIARKSGPLKELLQSASAEQVHHIKQVATSAGPMLSTNANIDTVSNDKVPTCLASLCTYDDDGDSSSDS